MRNLTVLGLVSNKSKDIAIVCTGGARFIQNHSSTEGKIWASKLGFREVGGPPPPPPPLEPQLMYTPCLCSLHRVPDVHDAGVSG